MNQPSPFALRACQMAWVVGRFYDRGEWSFSDHDKRCKFFTDLVINFEERWPVRMEIFPLVPLEVALDYSQQQELGRKRVALR